MVLLTMIVRVADSLPLAASMQEDEQVRMNPSTLQLQHLNTVKTHDELRELFTVFVIARMSCCCDCTVLSHNTIEFLTWSCFQSGRDLQKYQSQAKQLCRKLNDQSPARCTLEAGAMAFQWVLTHTAWGSRSLNWANRRDGKLSFQFMEIELKMKWNYCNYNPSKPDIWRKK